MKSTSAIVFDVDGTLVNDAKEILPETCAVVHRLQRDFKVEFILASARSPRSLEILAQKLDTKCGYVCFNGAFAYYLGPSGKREVATFEILPGDVSDALSEKLLAFDLTLSLFSADTWVASRDDYWLGREVRGTLLRPDNVGVEVLKDCARRESIHKIMCRGSESPITAALDEINRLDLPGVRVFSDRPTAIEVTPRNCNKLDALLRLLRRHNHRAENVIVFGDADNDLEMIQYFENSIAMGNGSEKLQESAKYIIGSNNDPAIAEFLSERLFTE